MKTCSILGCDKPRHGKLYCGMHKQRILRYGRPDFVQKSYTLQWFETCFEKSDGCWLWKRPLISTGYAHFFNRLAHRVSYEFYVGPIPPGAIIMHACDVRHCVNPEHLRAGTYAENMADMVSKGRNYTGETRKGLESPLTKFTAKDVETIRTAHATGMSMRAIARRFDVHHKTISSVVHGIRY